MKPNALVDHDAQVEKALKQLKKIIGELLKTRPTCSEDSQWYALKKAVEKLEAVENGNYR